MTILMTVLILVMTILTFEMLKASENAEKLDDNAKNAKKLIDEGNEIIRRINKDFQNKFIFVISYYIYENVLFYKMWILYIQKSYL